jgi:hypothetical protein
MIPSKSIKIGDTVVEVSGEGMPLDHRFHEAAPMSGIHLGDEAL